MVVYGASHEQISRALLLGLSVACFAALLEGVLLGWFRLRMRRLPWRLLLWFSIVMLGSAGWVLSLLLQRAVLGMVLPLKEPPNPMLSPAAAYVDLALPHLVIPAAVLLASFLVFGVVARRAQPAR